MRERFGKTRQNVKYTTRIKCSKWRDQRRDGGMKGRRGRRRRRGNKKMKVIERR